MNAIIFTSKAASIELNLLFYSYCPFSNLVAYMDTQTHTPSLSPTNKGRNINSLQNGFNAVSNKDADNKMFYVLMLTTCMYNTDSSMKASVTFDPIIKFQ